MTRPKISGKFYPLKHEKFLQLSAQLKDAELRVYLYLVTLEPFGDREIEIDTSIIAERLGMVRRTIQRALRRLEELELLDLEITRFKVKRSVDRQAIHRSPSDTRIASTTDGSPRRQMDRPSDTRIASTTHGSPTPPETQTGKGFQNSQTIQTYKDFIQTLSERERETFLKFARRKADRLPEPPQLVEKWIVDNHHWLRLEFEKINGQEPKDSGPGQGSAPPNSDEKNDLHPEIEAGLADGRIKKLDPYGNGLGLIDAKGGWWKADEWIEIAEGKGGVCPIDPNAQKYQLQCKKWFVQTGGNNPDDKTASLTPIPKLEEVL